MNWSLAGLHRAKDLGDLDARDLFGKSLVEALDRADVLLVRLRTRLDPSLLDAAPRLRAVVSPTTGVDHIAPEELDIRGIRAITLLGETAFLDSVVSSSEHSFALLLALMRRVIEASRTVLDGRWEQAALRGRDLQGKVLGVVGCGRVGRRMVRYAQAFGATVIVHDPNPAGVPQGARYVHQLEDLLDRCDILSVHVPFNHETEHLIGAAELARLRPGSWLLNTSRGAVVDEDALLEALERGHLAGAALDVLSHEHRIPTEGHPLIAYARTHPNLLITPHIAGASEEAIQATDLFVLGKLDSWLHDEWEKSHRGTLPRL